jgi:hypothetical protein
MRKLPLLRDPYKLLDTLLFLMVLGSFPLLIAIYLKSFNPFTWNRIHTPQFYVDSFQQQWGTLLKDLDVSSQAMEIGGKSYPTGLGTHGRSKIRVILKGNYSQFTGICGISSRTMGKGEGLFRIIVNGREVFNSGIVKGGGPAVPFNVDVRNHKMVELLVEVPGGSIDFSHANWAALEFK